MSQGCAVVAGSLRADAVGARRVAAAVVLALSAAFAAAPPAGAQTLPPGPCPAVMPVGEIETATAGPATFTATGLTVSRGDTPEPFTVEVLDVVEDGIGPDVDMIVARVDSPTIDRVGGIWSGMSGSPVYAADGRLIGAVSYGFSPSPSKLGGLTPAEAMMGVLTEGAARVEAAPRRAVRLPRAVARRIGRAAPLPSSRLRSLPLPVAVSGVRPDRVDAFIDALPARLGPVVPFRAAPPPVDPGDVARIRPGSNFGAALSYGDVTFGGVGTTTAVCDGFALAFGHPMLYTGGARASAHTADAAAITEDPTFASFKLANLGGVVGTVDQDRLVALRARLGIAPEPVPVTSFVLDPDRARSRQGRTNVNDPSVLAAVAGAHLASNIGRVIDRIGPGRSLVRWTVTGTADGAPFTLTRENRFAVPPAGLSDPFAVPDIAFASVEELQADVEAIVHNRFADVDVTSIAIDATVHDRYRAYRIEALERLRGAAWVTVDPDLPVQVTPGETLRVRLRLSSYRNASGTRFVERTIRVPGDFAPGTTAEIRVAGGAEDAGEDPPPAADEPRTFDELIASLRDAPRNDQIVAEARVTPAGDQPPRPPATMRETVDQVVTGSLTFQAEVPEPAGP